MSNFMKRFLVWGLMTIMVFGTSCISAFAADKVDTPSIPLLENNVIDGIEPGMTIQEVNEYFKNTDENAAEITDIRRTVTEDGTEEFEIEFQFTSPKTRGFGIGVGHFSRTSNKNQWQCWIEVSCSEAITQANYQLYWGIGNNLQYSDFTGLRTTYIKSGVHMNTYTKAGTYRPTCYVQIWSASGPWGTVSIPSIPVIVILLDL